ncbi:MAG: hypothetical protein JWQ42_712 [Edaphobacter sp.]|nr:hypothetical protein [Edaphobacter sp.]
MPSIAYLPVVHGAAGGLLAVAQGSGEEDDVVRARHRIRSSVWM